MSGFYIQQVSVYKIISVLVPIFTHTEFKGPSVYKIKLCKILLKVKIHLVLNVTVGLLE